MLKGKCSVCQGFWLLKSNGLLINHGGHFGFYCSGSGTKPVRGSTITLTGS